MTFIDTLPIQTPESSVERHYFPSTQPLITYSARHDAVSISSHSDLFGRMSYFFQKYLGSDECIGSEAVQMTYPLLLTVSSVIGRILKFERMLARSIRRRYKWRGVARICTCMGCTFWIVWCCNCELNSVAGDVCLSSVNNSSYVTVR